MIGWRKVGGIWFVRVGRVRLSFCMARTQRQPVPRSVTYI